MNAFTRQHSLVLVAALFAGSVPSAIWAATAPPSGGFDLADPTAGLTELASYHANLTVTFEGTRDGRPDSWSLTRSTTAGRDPSVRQIDEVQTGAAPHTWFRADVGGFRYERVDQGPCETAVIEVADVPASGNVTGDRPVDPEPAALLSGFLGAQEVAAETIDGIATTHYTFDERALGSVDSTASVGDVWVAANGGFVVRYTLTTEGASAWLGPGVQGVATFDYTLSAVGNAVTVAVPEDCPIGPVEAALPPDAHDIEIQPGRVTYLTASAPADVVAFHQADLASAGWQPDGSVLVGIDGRLASFVRTSDELSLIANNDPAGSLVTLVVVQTA